MNMDFFKGKKTIITMAVVAILAIVTIIANVTIPDFIWTTLAALGLGFMRASITHLSGNSGWKTYAAVFAFVVLGGLQAFGIVIPPDLLTAIYGLLTSFGIVGVRDALKEIPE